MIDVEILNSKNNYPIIKVNGFLLHSKYNPIREAEQFAATHYGPNKLHILYGYGLGYFAKALKKQFQFDEKLLVIDPFFNIEKKLEDVLYIEKNNFSDIESFLAQHVSPIDDVQFVMSPNYDKLNYENYKKTLRAIRNQIYSNKIGANTISKYSEDWYKNIIINSYSAINDLSLNKLIGKYSSPVVVASGGPSLTKQIPLLKKFRNNLLVIAAGSTVNSLLKEGIEPDYLVNIDGSKINIKHYENLKDTKLSFIYSLYGTYEIRSYFKGNAYYFNTNTSSNSLNSEFIKRVFNDDLCTVMGGSSVATFCLTIATKITTGPVCLIGQDLAYTNNMSHASDNKRFHQYTDEEIKQLNWVYETGYFGEDVLTDAGFISMKNDFEQIIDILKKENCTVYNCTEGGIKIRGTEQITFKQFCGKFADKKINELKSIDTINKERNLEGEHQYISYMQQQLKIFERLKRTINNSLLTLKIDKRKGDFQDKNLKLLAKNDEIIKEYLEEVNLPELLEKTTLQVMTKFKPKLNETKQEEFCRVYQQNEFLYNELLKNIVYAKDTVTKFLKEIDK